MTGNDSPRDLQRSTRRRILSASSSLLVAGLAGCTGGDSGESNNNPTDTPSSTPTPADTQTPTQTDTPTETPAPEVEPSAKVIDSEVFPAPFFSDGTGDDVPWLSIDIENSTQALHRRVEVETRFRDGNGDIIDTRTARTAVIPAGTTWRTYSRHDFEMDALEETEHTIVEQEVGTRGRLVEDFDVLNATMDFDNPSGVVSLTGEIELGNSEISDFVIVPLIYDSEGQYRGAFRILEDASQETIAFDDGLTGFGTPDGRPKPDNYELIIAEPLL